MNETNNLKVLFAVILLCASIIGNMFIISFFKSNESKMETVTGRAIQGKVQLNILSSSGKLNIPLEIGENWFSVPVIYQNKSVTNVLSPLGKGLGSGHDNPALAAAYPSLCTGNASDNYVGNYTILWTYNASDPSPWKSFNPNKFCFVMYDQDITGINEYQNYQITMTSADILYLNAPVKTTATYMNLLVGTNWIGYPTMNPINTTYALSTLGSGAGQGHDNPALAAAYPSLCTGNASDNYVGNYTILWTYNASDSSPWKSYNPNTFCYNLDSQGIMKMRPGSGYQITMTANDTWVVSW